MKKPIGGIIVSLIIVLLIVTPVFANREINLINDYAYLLTDDEYWELNERALAISQNHNCDIAIITIEYMEGEDAYQLAKHLYEEYGLGYGEDKSILLLFLSMEERDYALIAHGYGNIAFTDYGKDVILDDNVLPLLGKDKYYEAFSKYLDLSEEYLGMARGGSPFDRNTDPDYGKLAPPFKLGIVFLLPMIIAAIITGIWKSQMKTAVLARTAGSYITADGLKLTNQQDHFLYHTETRRKIEKKSSGGTTKDKSGTSGRSGKF
ncbi:MAG TPA: TPM domain-containing protein [Clostridia bacterium]|nr:TPM domain-containing protein [Clostridia bacterium]